MATVPTVKLSDGNEIPIIGLGTWFKNDGVEAAYNAVKYAIEVGYRHIDGAMIYENEAAVGRALRESISDGKTTREELFITSKLWNTHHRKEKVIEGCKKTLSDLGLEYVDLYLVHWPVAFKEDAKDENDLFEDIDLTETWEGMEECCDKGLARSIGLSNFNSEQIEEIYEVAKIKPTVLQIECHPYLNQKKLIDFCKPYEIAVTAYSSLGSRDRPLPHTDCPDLLANSEVNEIANNHQKTAAQVLIRFQIQRGIIVIPKSKTPERIKSNFQVFDFELAPSEMEILSNFEDQFRYISADIWKEAPNYPFNIEF